MKLPDSAVKLCLRPVVAERPQIISYSPITSGTIKDAGIQVLFDHDMDEGSIYYTEEEIVALKKEGVADEVFLPEIPNDLTGSPLERYGYKKDGEVIFKNISIKNNNDGSNINSCFDMPVFETSRQLSIPVKDKNALEDFTSVLVTIEKGFFYIPAGSDKHIEMAASKKWLYQVSDQTDTKALIVASSSGEDLISLKIGNDELDKTLPLLALDENSEKWNDLKFLQTNDTQKKLTIENLKVQEPESGSGPRPYFTLHVIEVFDKTYKRLDKNDTPIKRSLPVYYDNTSSDFGVLKNYEVDLSSPNLDDGIYQLYFELIDRSENSSFYPSAPDAFSSGYDEFIDRLNNGENPESLINEYEQLFEKYKSYYFAIDKEIEFDDPVVTDISDSEGVKLKLSITQCIESVIDFERAEIKYKKESDTSWSDLATLNRESSEKEYTGLDLTTSYEFEVTFYDYAGNHTTKTINHTTDSWTILVTTNDSVKNVYLQGEAFDSKGIIVNFMNLENNEQRQLSYTNDSSADGWTCNFSTDELAFDKVVEVSYTYENVTKTAKLSLLYYVARSDALTLSPQKYENYKGTLGEASDTVLYYKFGDFPQTISDYSDESYFAPKGVIAEPVYNGWYLSREDGYFYAKCLEEIYDDNPIFYSNSESASARVEVYRYFKVEPIVWAVIDSNYNSNGKALLLSEKILTSCQYYDNTKDRIINGQAVNPNDYKNSRVYALLNGLSYFSGSLNTNTDFEGKGLLQLAFTPSARDSISEDANGKLFLLEKSQIYNTYGTNPLWQHLATDYALAKGVYQKNYGYPGDYSYKWWTKTGSDNNSEETSYVYYVEEYHNLSTIEVNTNQTTLVDTRGNGVVPAIIIQLPE